MIDLPRRRKVVQALALAMATPLFSACGGGSGSESDSADPTPDQPAPNEGGGAAGTTKFMVYPNALDPRILGGTTDDGEQFVLYGEKDASGKAIALEEMIFIGPELETAAVKFFPAEKKIVSIGNGIQTELTDNGAEGLIFGLVAGDKQLAINLPAQAGGGSATPKSLSRPFQSRLGKRAAFTLGEGPCFCAPGKKSVSASQAQAAAGFAPIATINVAGCVGRDPIVKVIMRDEAGKVQDVLFAKPGPAGTYNAVLSSVHSSDQAFADAAQHALDLMADHFGLHQDGFALVDFLQDQVSDEIADKVWDELEAKGKTQDIYEEFAEYLNLTPDDVSAVQKRAKFLAFVTKSLSFMFNTLDVFSKITLAYEAGLVLADFADAYMQKEFNRIQLQPVVETGDGQKFTGASSGLLLPEGPYPDLSVSVPGNVSISSLVLSPANPSEGENYRAAGEVFCLEAGDEIVLSVVGTDGYHDQLWETSSGAERQSFELSVPGALSGVNDVVVLRVVRKGDVVASRSASLVLG